MCLLLTKDPSFNYSKSVKLPKRRYKQKNGKQFLSSLGYGFVTFGDEQSLEPVIEKFNDFDLKGRKISVNVANHKPKPKKPETPAKVETNGSVAEANGEESELKKSKAAKKKSAKKERIPFEEGTKSLDTIYLRNLDFKAQSSDINEALISKGENPQWISVPLRRLPKRLVEKLAADGKTPEQNNKGYAFVKLELKDGETIDEKVEKLQDLELNGRPIQVRVAIDVRPREESKEESNDAEPEAEPEAEAAVEVTEENAN